MSPYHPQRQASSFSERVYALCARVPRGRVTTYQAIALALGMKAYQAVGQALHRNPYAPQVPCHRVVASGGRIGGFAAGPKRKIALLKQEGVMFKDGRVVGFQERLFEDF